MSKVLPFPFLIKVWNGSSWRRPNYFAFHEFGYIPVLLHDSLLSACAERDYLRVNFGVDACVFLHGACLSGKLSVPCHD